MAELLGDYWPVILLALVLGAIVGFLLFRPRQRVRLSDEAPRRPHMTAEPAKKKDPIEALRPAPTPVPAARSEGRGEGRGLADEAAAAFSDVSGEILGTDVHGELAGAADDLQRIKGVGPKFANLLHSQGIFRFEQIARLTPNEVERIDAAMGAFRGRFTRDRIVEQADYLARGDEDGYERTFGRL
jgi:predicted flap endonuclease-1-like 5' DNA nuclease